MLIQRLSAPKLQDTEFMANFYDAVKKYPGCCDEVWLCSYYGWPPLEKHRELAHIFKEEAKKLRAAGIKVSVQLSNTIGHGDYQSGQDCTGMINGKIDADRLMGHDGTVGRYNFCPRGEEFTKYVAEEARIYAEVMPDCIWLDDDYGNRGHSPVIFGCFCDSCMEKFNKENGTSYTREQLAHEYLYGDVSVRDRFIEFTRDGLYELTYKIAKGFHEISPKTCMGFQHGRAGAVMKSNYNHYFRAAKEVTGKSCRIRPGAGGYNDRNPDNFPMKYNTLFGSIALFENVDYIAPEVESLPNVVFGKSVAGTCLETSIYLMGGANHMSYASIQNTHERFETYHINLLAECARHKPYWEKLVSINNVSRGSGIRIYTPEYAYLKVNPEGTTMAQFNEDSLGHQPWYINCAIPLTHDIREKSVVYIDDQVAQNLSAKEIEVLEGIPVICDGSVLAKLVSLGMTSDITAVPLAKDQCYGLKEVFTAHTLAGEREGYIWGGAGSAATFWGYYPHNLICKEGKAEILSNFVNKHGETIGAACAIITTSKGVKWMVLGNNTQMSFISTAKQRQFINGAEYISGKPLPAKVLNPFSSFVIPRSNAEGKTVSVSILNKTVGETGEFILRVHAPASTSFTFMSQTVLKEIPISATPVGDDLYDITVPSIPGWSVATVCMI